ncbi:ankyrin repeat protein, partial [Pavlovales sp. CCMP2436]
ALLTAATHGHRAAVSVLVNAGASVFKQDAAGLSPLMLASANGHVDAVRALIKASAPVNAPGGPGGNTALSLAARNGRAAVVAELLRNGAN